MLSKSDRTHYTKRIRHPRSIDMRHLVPAALYPIQFQDKRREDEMITQATSTVVEIQLLMYNHSRRAWDVLDQQNEIKFPERN